MTDQRAGEVECEWVGTFPKCHAPATGYAGGPTQQHPLCDEHVKPEHHPLREKGRLHPNEPITAPCYHLTGDWPTRAAVSE